MQNRSVDGAFCVPVNPFLKLFIYVLNASSRASPATHGFAPRPHYCVLFIYLGDSTEAYVCSRFDQ